MWHIWPVTPPVKERSLRAACMIMFRTIEEMQEKIVDEINKKYVGQTVDVLFEEKVKNRWKGRTPTNKLVFIESDEDLKGKIVPVTITWTGPWSMQAQMQRQTIPTAALIGS